MNLLLGPALKYIAAGLGAILLVVTGLWRFEAHRVTVVKGERDDALHQVAELTSAVDGKNTTIAALDLAVGKWQSLSIPADAMAKAAERTEAAAELIRARTAALTPAEVKDHANPDCTALLALDIAKLCPAIAYGVRIRAIGGVQGQTSGNSRTGGAPTP